MKVIIIGPAYPLRGGIADSSEALARSLKMTGIQASIVSYSLQYPKFLFPGKTQFTTDPPPSDLEIHSTINSINPLSWRKTARFVNRENPDLVIIRYWLPFMAMALGSIARMLRHEIKIIALCDNVIPHEHRIGDKWLTGFFVRACDAIMTFSGKVAEEVKTFTANPVAWYPLPMDTRYTPRMDKISARKKLGLDPTKNYLLFFGLVRDYKGLDLLLEALGREEVKKLEIHLLVAGEFYVKKSDYLDQVNRLGLRDRVTIRDEFIPSAEIATYFSAVDMVSQTYKSASQSGVTQIAYFYDCPMLVTDVGGLSETVPNGKVGYVVPPDPDAIALAITDFFENRRFDMFSKNVALEKDRFTWDKFRENILKLYHTLT